MSSRMDLNLLGETFTDYHLADVGASAFSLYHDWFTRQDLVIRTAAAGGGTLLVEGTDYILDTESLELSERVSAAVGSGRNVFREIAIINAAYQSGDLYFSGKYIADSVEAEDYNTQQTSLDALFSASRPLRGLVLSNNSGDANNDIDIATGTAIDSAGTDAMMLSSILTKRSDAAWAVGTGNGGMDTGTKPANGWLYVWLIKRPDTGVVDALFSTSATAPIMPTSYTLKRRLGAVRTSSSNILAFEQFGDDFRFKAFIQDRAFAALSDTNRTLTTLTVPPNMTARVSLRGYSTAQAYGWIASTGYTDAAASGTHCLFRLGDDLGIGEYEVPADGSSQVAWRFSSATTSFGIVTLGWKDMRGKDGAA